MSQEIEKLWSGVKPARSFSKNSRREEPVRGSRNPSDLEKSQHLRSQTPSQQKLSQLQARVTPAIAQSFICARDGAVDLAVTADYTAHHYRAVVLHLPSRFFADLRRRAQSRARADHRERGSTDAQ